MTAVFASTVVSCIVAAAGVTRIRGDRSRRDPGSPPPDPVAPAPVAAASQ
ncbi:MAG: hypothetical protein M3487_03575 [Actinomycetota bacterium]|nr:hypothetical protein [Acidimicrobiia bacterium]MDQ3468842.1 hypothetical protein [Actinomycetota bacterium]